MTDLSDNGKKALKLIFTDFLINYNSNNIRAKLEVSNAGSLKLLRSMEKKNILRSERMGRAIFYKPNLNSEYVLKLLELILLDHANLSNFVKGWVSDLRIFAQQTKAIFLFGSILRKGKEARDVDVCLILKNPQDYSKIQAQINEMNKKNRLKIHPLYLTENEFEKKLREKDEPLIDMVKKCVVVHGQELLVEVLKNVQS